MSLSLTRTERVAEDVLRLPIAFVNAYALGKSGGEWVLVDTGIPQSAGYIQQFAKEEMGGPPQAIVLTHGHFDHAGNALTLAEEWDVPVYAHRLELPFLNGRSDYPPGDSSMGGAIAHLARVFPNSGFDLGDRLRELPSLGEVPVVEGWRWIHTPGHTAGHVSLWRETDRTLVAGDAFATMDLDSWTTQFTHARELARPAAPFTPDWDAAAQSLKTLADLRPAAVGAGHGRAMSEVDLADQLERYAAVDHRPDYGRYRDVPVRYDAVEGLASVPPPVMDVAGWRLAIGAAAVGFGVWAIDRLAAPGRRR